MASIIPNGFGIARHVFNLAGRSENFVVTMGYRQPTNGGDFDGGPAAEAIAAAWSSATSAFAADKMVTAYRYLGVETTMMTPSGPFMGSASRNVVGTNGGSPMPSNCSILVTKRTNRGGRKGRGRMYVPPIHWGEASVDGHGLMGDAVSLDIIQGAYDAALTIQLNGDYEPVLLHSDGTTPNTLTALTVQPLVATQRRRLR